MRPTTHPTHPPADVARLDGHHLGPVVLWAVTLEVADLAADVARLVAVATLRPIVLGAVTLQVADLAADVARLVSHVCGNQLRM